MTSPTERRGEVGVPSATFRNLHLTPPNHASHPAPDITDNPPEGPPCSATTTGGGTRSSTRSICAASPTANGDGMGDLPGVRERLPYLARARRGRGLAEPRSTPRRWPTAATTWPTTATSTRCSARWPTSTRWSRDAHELGLRVIVDLVPNHSSDQHAWFQRRSPTAPARAARALPLPPGRARRRTAAQRLGVHLRRPGLDPGSPTGEWYLHLFAPEQPDLNWDTPGGARRVPRRSCGSGWTGAWTASASTWRTAWSRPPGCPTSADARRRPSCSATSVVPFFDQDGVHEIYRALARRSSTRYPGERIAVAEAWMPDRRAAGPLRRAPTSCTRRSTSSSCGAAGTRPSCARSSTTSLAAMRPVGAPDHLGAVQPRRDPARHPLRQPAGWHPVREPGDRRWPAPGPRRDPADAGAARLGLPLPGRGAGPARGHRPAGRGCARTRRSSAPPAQDGFRDGCRVPIPWSGDRAPVRLRPGGQPWLPQPAPRGRAERRGPDRRPGLDPGAVPGRAAPAPGAPRARRRHP